MRNLFAILMLLTITACGTTSGIKQNGEEVLNLDLSSYNSVVVTEFRDGTKKQNLPEYAGSNFADRIVSAIRSNGVFKTVTNDQAKLSGKAMVVGGDITRYAAGNAALRLMIGMGAGSTYFDAKVLISDFTSQDQLGEITVDKNSWALGGAIAAGQTVDQFMNEAAEKIADELANAKNKPIAAE